MDKFTDFFLTTGRGLALILKWFCLIVVPIAAITLAVAYFAGPWGYFAAVLLLLLVFLSYSIGNLNRVR